MKDKEFKTVLKHAVVLDLSDIDAILPIPGDAPAWLREVAKAAGKHYDTSGISQTPAPNMEFVRWIADQIEAQTKPPRIPEPGLWGVVEASLDPFYQRLKFVRHEFWWYAADIDAVRHWSELIDPVLIRPGIEDES